MKRILQGVIMSWGLLIATLAGAVSLPTTKDACLVSNPEHAPADFM